MTRNDFSMDKERVADEKDVSPEIAGDAPYQMPLKMTMADRRQLIQRAKDAGTSPTRWLIKKIQDGDGTVSSLANKGITFYLDKRRQQRAEALARQLGFHQTADLAKDLLYRALESPAEAEKFLFGQLEEGAGSSTDKA